MQQTPIPNAPGTPDGDPPGVEPKNGRWPSLPPALRFPAYRNYWFGLLASVSGYQMFRAAQAWFVYELTGSPLFLGYAAAANAAPGIVFNLVGGVFADRLNKRLLVMATQAANAGLIFFLAVLTVLDLVQVWHILIIVFLSGAVEAFDTPARQAIYPHLIDRRVMMSAVALNSVVWSGNRIVAPAFAGFLIAATNMETSFFVAGFGFAIMSMVMLFLKVPPIPRGSRGNPLQDMLEGLKFIKANTIISFLIGMTFFNSFFGMAYVFMIPVFAQDHLGLGAGEYGMLLGISGVGSLAINFWLGSRSTINTKARFIIGGAVMFGVSLIAFGLTSAIFHSYGLALAILCALGMFTSFYMISIQSTLQMMVPDRVRGRVMGFYGMTWSIMPLGGMQAGALANVGIIGAPGAVIIGGLAVAAFALGPALLNRKIRNLDAAPEQDSPQPIAGELSEETSQAHADGC